jgi:hypothetical protein
MPLVRIGPKPGVNTQLSQTQNADGWFATNLVRWKGGLLEKIAGWLRLFDEQCAGYIRALHGWVDLDNDNNLLLGTDGGAQLLVNTTLYDVTLIGSSAQGGSGSSSFANFSVSSSSTTVTVGIPTTLAATIVAGQSFILQMPVSIGNRLLASGSTFVTTAVAASSFTFSMPLAATASQSNVPGIPLFSFYLTTGTVSLRRHGLIVGGTFHVDQTTKTVQDDNYITIPAGADLTVVTVPSVDSFTFNAGPFGASVRTDGPPNVYEGTQVGSPTTYGIVFSFSSTASAVNPLVQDWSLGNFGEIGLLLYTHSPLFAYQPPVGETATFNAVGAGNPATAPQSSHGMLVAMPQAQVLLYGTEPVLGEGNIDHLLIRFSDAGDYETWTATASNQAGSYRLSRGSVIIGVIQAPLTTLIFTDTDVWAMSYQGPPLVYGFTVMGSGCGLVGPKAVGIVGRTVYWLGSNNIWEFGANGLRPVPCSVWDVIFRDIDTSSISLAFAASNSGLNEIAFYYPSLQDAPAAPTNLLAFSEVFSNESWMSDGAAAVNAIAAPDGNMTATRLVEDATTGVHESSQIVAKARASITMTFAVYAQTTSTRWLHFFVGGGTGSVELFVNPIAGSVISTVTNGVGWTVVTSGSSTDVYATGIAGNGWLRYYITFTTDSSPSITVTFGNAEATTLETSYLGNGIGNVYVWGAQLNLGALAVYEQTGSLARNNPSRYVKYNVAENLWDYGQLVRTAWLDDNIFGPPLGGDTNFRVQQHEMGYDDDTEPMSNVFAETGYGTVSDGSTIMLVDQCEPDMKWFGNDGAVTFTLKSLRYPGGPQNQFGPYSVTPTTQFFSTRVRAKLVAQRIDWAPLMGYSARVGATAFRVKPAGTRP